MLINCHKKSIHLRVRSVGGGLIFLITSCWLTFQCSISIETTALQLNLELWVGGGPFDLIDSQSPFNLDLDLDFWIWTFGLTIFSAFFVKKKNKQV